jgi:type IV secretory pathway VirB4 component
MTVDPAGIIFGINQATNVPIIRDIFGFMNPNVLVVGGSGSGKSYFTKLMLSRYVMRGVHVSIIDPSGEYTNIVRALGGESIELSSRSNSMINPLDLLGYDLDEKLLSLADLFEIIFGKMSPEQKSALMDAAIETYKRFGITVDMTKTAKKKRIKQPTLGDLYKTMLELKIDKSMLSAIKPYVEGALSFLNCHTKLKLDANPISFNLRDLPKAARPLVMHIILDYIYSRMRTSLGKKMLVVDEAWSLLRHARTRGDVPFLLEIVKTSRKFNLSLTLLVQEINDLIKSDAGEAILANTSCKFFFRQDSAVIKPLAERLGLNLHERRLLLSAGVGEGLLIADEERIPIRVIASQAEHKLITTKPGEISG